MKQITIVGAAVVWATLLSSLHAGAQTWKIDPSTSAIGFKIKNAGLTVNGSFSQLTATIVFDPNNLKAAQITASIPTRTIRTGIGGRDKHLRSEDYFEVAKYPDMAFTSNSVSQTKDGFIAKGKLTIKDVTQQVDIPFTFKEQGNQGTFNATFDLNRLQYHVGSSSWILSNEVKVFITLKAVKEPM